MSAKILEGPVVAGALNDAMSAKVEELKASGIVPTLGILRIGERDDDISYEKGATKRAEGIGINIEKTVLPADATQTEIINAVEDVNKNDAISGLLMFRPLPKGIDEDAVCNTLSPAKDVDSCTEQSLISVFTGAGGGFAPCTAQACIEILDYYDIDLAGKNVVVVGRSLVIGKPVAMMLLSRNATVTIAHSRTKDLPEITKRADIVIACVGRAQMLDGSYFSPGQVVIDVGINFNDEGKMVGDVNFDEASEIVAAITPVPRGVGSVTTSVLCKHVVEAAEAARK